MVPTDHCALDTPITWAVHLNDEKLVDHLLKKGAKIEIPVTGLNAYDWAVTSPTIRALMMPHGGEFLQKQDYFFYNAIGKNDLKMVKSFLDKTPTLLGLSRQGYTPLAWAKRWEKKDVATYLENRLAFVQQELAGAARYGDIALIDKSLDGGAKINGFDSKGLAPLHWACIQGNSETIASLIDKNADLNIVDRNKGRTGLRWLLRMHTGSVKKDGRQITTEMLLPGFFLLASAGADPNVPDIYGQSVVDWIPYQGFNETEKTLVNKALKAKDLTNSERKLLLENIHSFQKNKCMADSDTRKLSVKKHRTRSNSFKDIYKKYIEL
jgi:ankyrin repeat protein